MAIRANTGAALVLLVWAIAPAVQTARGEEPAANDPKWKSRGEATEPRDNPGRDLAPVGDHARTPIARVSGGSGTLPNTHGQVWREYDISPYTLRVSSTVAPEQAIVDWILRDTGYEAWHSQPLGILSADSRTLRVYHTPELQAVVADVVDRFVNSEAELHAFGVRVVTVDNPNWRAKVHSLIRPVAVQTQGVQAWLMEKENASLLLAELRKRNDFREHSSPHLLVNNGQSAVVAATRARNYVKDILIRPDVWPGYEVQMGNIDEGFSLELSPLLSLDSRSIDAVLKCNIDQVEKMLPVMLDVPTTVAPRQRARIEVPQMTQCRLQERFRWPVDQVLLIGLGMVATPIPSEATNPLFLGLPIPTAAARADLLVFVESKGKTGHAPTVTRTGRADDARTYRGRY